MTPKTTKTIEEELDFNTILGQSDLFNPVLDSTKVEVFGVIDSIIQEEFDKNFIGADYNKKGYSNRLEEENIFFLEKHFEKSKNLIESVKKDLKGDNYLLRKKEGLELLLKLLKFNKITPESINTDTLLYIMFNRTDLSSYISNILEIKNFDISKINQKSINSAINSLILHSEGNINDIQKKYLKKIFDNNMISITSFLLFNKITNPEIFKHKKTVFGPQASNSEINHQYLDFIIFFVKNNIIKKHELTTIINFLTNSILDNPNLEEKEKEPVKLFLDKIKKL